MIYEPKLRANLADALAQSFPFSPNEFFRALEFASVDAVIAVARLAAFERSDNFAEFFGKSIERAVDSARSRCPECGDNGIGSEKWGGHHPACSMAKRKVTQ